MARSTFPRDVHVTAAYLFLNIIEILVLTKTWDKVYNIQCSSQNPVEGLLLLQSFPPAQHALVLFHATNAWYIMSWLQPDALSDTEILNKRENMYMCPILPLCMDYT